jgi:hypothetical protein
VYLPHTQSPCTQDLGYNDYSSNNVSLNQLSGSILDINGLSRYLALLDSMPVEM